MKSIKIMITLLTAGFLASTSSASAKEFPFFTSEAPGYLSEFGIADFNIADLDGNGTADVITSEPAGDCLKVFLAMENEFFSTPTSIPVNHPTCFTTGDFNGDGILEIAVCQPLRNRVAVFTRQPTGSYELSAAYQIAGEFNDILADYLNADEHLDLAVLTNNNTLRILQNQGDGTFNNPDSGYFCRCSSGKLHAGDFNGDGYIDLAGWDCQLTYDPGGSPWGYYVRELFIQRNDGAGGFQERQTSTIRGPGSDTYEMGVSDIDGDGDLDCVLTCLEFWLYDNLSMILLKNDGSGNFPDPETVFGALFQMNGSHVISDIDNDGDPDILIGPGAFLMQNNGNGTFRKRQPHSMFKMSHMICADLNNDGYEDIVGRTGDNSIAVLFHDLVSGFRSGCSYTDPNNFCKIGLHDFDNDGNTDLLLARSSDGYFDTDLNSLAIFLNDGSGDIGEKVWESNHCFYSRSRFFCQDFDADGDQDIIFNVCSNEGYKINVADNNGHAEFSVVTIISSPDRIEEFCCLDYDNDTRMDLAVALSSNSSSDPDYFSVYRQNETGGFELILQRTLSYTYTMKKFLSADYNYDGKTDVLIVDQTELTCYLNSSENPFTEVVTYDLQSPCRGFEIADINNDGAPDFASVSTDLISILLNDGAGNLAISDEIPGECMPTAVLFHDWDKDGLQDLTIGDCSGIRLYRNAGDGTFIPPETFFGTCRTPKDIGVSDLDSDGDDDMVAACGELTFLFNQEFSPQSVPGMHFFLEDSEYAPYSTFSLGAVCRGDNTIQQADLYSILEILGHFYFWPDWSDSYGMERIWLSDTPRYINILHFELPDFEPSPALTGLRFWGALMEPGTVNLIGDIDCVTFDFGSTDFSDPL